MGSSEELAEALETLEEGLEELKSGHEKSEEVTEEINGLLERVKEAREDPGSMTGDSYGELLTDITKFGGDQLPLTKPMSKAIGVASHAISSLIGLETDFAIRIIAKRFVDSGGNSEMSEEDAKALAKKVSWDSTSQAAVFLWWRRGMPRLAYYSFGARLVKPLETFWIWLRTNVFGGIGVSTSSGCGCAAAALFFALLIAIVGWLVFGGGDEVPSTSTSTTTTTTTTTTVVVTDPTTTTTTTAPTTTAPTTTTTAAATTSTTAAPTTSTTAAPTTSTTAAPTTSTTAPPEETSKSVSVNLPCPQPVGGQSWIDVNIPADAVNPTHSVSPSPWGCPDTEVSISGGVISAGVYRVTFTATAGSGAPGETVSTTVTVNWTNP